MRLTKSDKLADGSNKYAPKLCYYGKNVLSVVRRVHKGDVD
jgi:hypothetical protein